MRQLVTHIIQVRLIPPTGHVCSFEADVADIDQARDCGRRISTWLTKGEGYRAESETFKIVWANTNKYNLTKAQIEQAHAAKIRQQQQDGA